MPFSKGRYPHRHGEGRGLEAIEEAQPITAAAAVSVSVKFVCAVAPGVENAYRTYRTSWSMKCMFFAFPENARWNAERQAVEFGVEIGEYHGVVRVPRRVFQRLLPERPTPERCVEAYYLQRTRFESIAERKLRRRQLTEDGNVEITGRDLREGSAVLPLKSRAWR
jgi:hypothetical protein